MTATAMRNMVGACAEPVPRAVAVVLNAVDHYQHILHVHSRVELRRDAACVRPMHKKSIIVVTRRVTTANQGRRMQIHQVKSRYATSEREMLGISGEGDQPFLAD
jgi:hypothetical protein